MLMMTNEDTIDPSVEASQLLENLENRSVAQTILDRMNAIEDKLDDPPVVVQPSLWKLEHVAQYMETTVHTARRILKRPGAPRPIQIPTSETSLLPDRYEPEEIKHFCLRAKRKRT